MLEEPLKAKFKYLLFFGFIEDRTGFLKMVYPSGRKSGQKKISGFLYLFGKNINVASQEMLP